MLYIDNSSVNQAEEKFLSLMKEELHNELRIEMDESESDLSEDEKIESVPPKGLEPQAKRAKLSNAAEKTQTAKPTSKSTKRKKMISLDAANKENATPKKKVKKTEKPKSKRKVQ